jgi:hypothetical protein
LVVARRKRSDVRRRRQNSPLMRPIR